MDPAAERRIEERLNAHFGGNVPAASYDARGLQTWGTFFREGSAADNKPERPPSPYTDLFLEPLIRQREAAQASHRSGLEQTNEKGHVPSEENQVQVGSKRPRANGSTDSFKEVAETVEDVDGPPAERENPASSQEQAESGSDGSEEEDDEESSDDGCTSPSDAEDDLKRVTSFRDQVADNERYRKRIRDAHTLPPPG